MLLTVKQRPPLLSNIICLRFYFHSVCLAEQTSQFSVPSEIFLQPISVTKITSKFRQKLDLPQESQLLQVKVSKRKHQKKKKTRVSNESGAAMVNVIVDPLSDHVGYHILHWIISQSGAWYSKVNENLQDNLRSLETGVAVIDDILTPKEEENPYENQQVVEDEDISFHHLNGIFQHDSNEHHINILNQIINMNINYNESSSSSECHSIRGNSPTGNNCSLN